MQRAINEDIVYEIEGWICFYLGLDVSLLYEADVHVKFKRIERSENFLKV